MYERTSRSVQSIYILYISLSLSWKSVVMLREKSMKTELSNSRYSRHVIASVNGLLNFNPIMILPFTGWDYDPPTHSGLV